MGKITLYPADVQTAEGRKWGYIDNQGKFVLAPQFQSAEDFQDNGLAIVQVQDRYGAIDLQGNFVVPPRYQGITSFREGRAVAIDEQGSWVIDEKGQVLTDKAYNFIGEYHSGRAVFATADSQGNYLYGYLNLEGREVVPSRFLAAEDFVADRAVVQLKPNQYALIDLNGNIVAVYNVAFLGNLGEGLLAYKVTDQGMYGYIDEQGHVIIPPRYSWAGTFHEGRAVVNTSAPDVITNNYGLIDRTGHFLIKPAFETMLYVGEGRFAVGKAVDPQKPYLGTKYALADTEGKFLTRFVFTDISQFQNGLASASNGTRTFFIDTTGRYVKRLPIVYGAGTLSYVGALIKAFIDYRLTYYAPDGRTVWQHNTLIPLNNRYAVKEEKYKPNKDYLVYYPQVEGIGDQKVQKSANKKLADLSQVIPIKSQEQLDYSFFGDFDLQFFRNRLLVLKLSSYRYPFGAAHGMPSEIYPHLDLVTGRFYQLRDLFKPGSNYVQVISAIIGDQIKNNPEYSYVFPDSYHGIKPDQPFYVSLDALYVYFLPYEIAPYVAGFPTFRIPFAGIAGIIDEQGSFWKAFH